MSVRTGTPPSPPGRESLCGRSTASAGGEGRHARWHRAERRKAVEEKIGVVTDYLNRIGVAVVRLTDGDLRVGDEIRITGQTTELTQAVESLQLEHQAVEQTRRGAEVAVKVQTPVRRRDQVFRIHEG
jgi:putative protease